MTGRILNSRYELTEKIGEGGMALTWKGRDLLLGRTVAVKLMRDTLAASQEFISCFRQEAQAAASLTHEHIAGVYDFGNEGDIHYIVMEYVPGEDLRKRLRRKRRLAVNEAIGIATQVAEALQAAHAKGLVHRDIKPANILLGEGEQVKVADFGIARAAATTEDTSTDMLLGSVHYISPEQAHGAAVGPQADIYSLGVVLFEMLTGRPPFQASNAVAVVHKHVYDPPPSVTALRKDVPVELEGIINRCLAKENAARYANAGELLSYLRALQARLAAQEEQAPARAPARNTSRPPGAQAPRLWRSLRIIAVVLLLLFIAAVLFAGPWRKEKDTRVKVPHLIDLDISSARVVAEAGGLSVREIGKVYSETIREGRIVSQSPAEDTLMEQGRSIGVMISLGRENTTVPELTEMTLAQARRLLEAAGLTLGATREEFDAEAPAGTVIASEPAAGTELARQSAVGLIISQGPETQDPPLDADPNNPPGGGREISEITYSVPDALGRDVEILVEIEDARGRSIIYRDMVAPGDSIPPQKLPSVRPITVRIKMNGKLVEEKHLDR